AAMKAVIEVLRRPDFLPRVRDVAALLRSACRTGPVTGVQGAGLLLGLRTRSRAVSIRDALLARDILVGTSADPHVLRLLPPLILEAEHVARLVQALGELGDASL